MSEDTKASIEEETLNVLRLGLLLSTILHLMHVVRRLARFHWAAYFTGVMLFHEVHIFDSSNWAHHLISICEAAGTAYCVYNMARRLGTWLLKKIGLKEM